MIASLFRKWMQSAQSDMESGGEIKPARVIYATADDKIRLGDAATRRARRLKAFLAHAERKDQARRMA